MSSAADTTPISPARFASALQSLSVEMLHLKVLEIRNSIAHLQYSNDQLQPFAEGSSTATTASAASNTSSLETAAAEPDQDCIDAIRENEQVIDRMNERIALIRLEVEERGMGWTEFQSKDELEARQQAGAASATAAADTNGEAVSNGSTEQTGRPQESSPWTDGTFQTGTIRNGEVHFDQQPRRPEGGSLSDEELRRALEERMRNLSHEDDEESGMHL